MPMAPLGPDSVLMKPILILSADCAWKASAHASTKKTILMVFIPSSDRFYFLRPIQRICFW